VTLRGIEARIEAHCRTGAAMANPPTFDIGLFIFPRITQLDITGPFEVLARVPGARIHWIWKTLEPVQSDAGLALAPTVDFASCPRLDVICVPGGPGINALLEDEEVLAFLRRQAREVRFLTSVCAGSLVLGAAGLLVGTRAACHWLSRDMLKEFGAIPDPRRVVVDGKHISGGGVTAGIDFAFAVAAALVGEAKAKEIQLLLEYNPQPPFRGGTPDEADPATLATVQALAQGMIGPRLAAVKRAAAKLELPSKPA
jgi:cyclohexyl-isocyanide hydratase